MGRLFFWSCIGLCLYYLQTTGILNAVMHGNVPETGRICEVAGPKGGKAFFSPNKEEMRWPIDATIGFSLRDRRPGQARLNTALDTGLIINPANHTKIKVLGNHHVEVYKCWYRVVKVQILNGAYKGKKGWMLREDVIDTPLQQFIQEHFRAGAKHFNEELETATPRVTTKYDLDF